MGSDPQATCHLAALYRVPALVQLGRHIKSPRRWRLFRPLQLMSPALRQTVSPGRPDAVCLILTTTGKVLQTAWFGASPVNTTGNGFVPGARRTILSGLPDISPSSATIPSTEQLMQLTPNAGGSSPSFQKGFSTKWNLIDAPVDYVSTSSTGKGILAGTWDTMSVSASGNQTYWHWNIYACFSAEFDFAAFHESAMKNVTSILQAQGKTEGSIIGPYSF